MKISRILIATAVAATLSAGQFVSAGTIDDAALTAKVKTALIANPVTKAHQIDVESKAGTVQLNGFVDSAEGRNEAATVARGVEGVATVENNLEVKGTDRTPGVAMDDAAITSKVKATLLADTSTRGLNINVETRDGVVQLNGFAQDEAEREAAARLAGAVGGVTSVHNNLTVKK